RRQREVGGHGCVIVLCASPRRAYWAPVITCEVRTFHLSDYHRSPHPNGCRFWHVPITSAGGTFFRSLVLHIHGGVFTMYSSGVIFGWARRYSSGVGMGRNVFITCATTRLLANQSGGFINARTMNPSTTKITNCLRSFISISPWFPLVCCFTPF